MKTAINNAIKKRPTSRRGKSFWRKIEAMRRTAKKRQEAATVAWAPLDWGEDKPS